MAVTVLMSSNTVEVTDLRDAFRWAKDNNIAVPIEKLMVIGEKTVLRNFHVGGRPNRWKPLKNREGKPLMLTGVLRNTVEPKKLGPANFKIHSGGHPVARWQNFGTKPKEFGTKSGTGNLGWPVFGFMRYAKRVSHPGIPARPFMLWQKEDATQMANVIADHIIEQVGKRGKGDWRVSDS